MKLTNKELIEEFYEREKDKYPGISLDEFKAVCYAPWDMTRRAMESGELETVRLKYFGTFQVYPKRAEQMLNNLKERFKYHKIDSRQYFELKEMIEKFLEKHEKMD